MVNDDILIWWKTIQPFKIIYDKYHEITCKHAYKIILNKILQETEYMLREQLSYSGCLPSPVPLIGFNPSTRHPVRTKYPGLCYCKFLVFPLSLLLQKQSLLVLFVCLLNLTGARIWGFGFYKVIPSGMSQEDKRASKNLKRVFTVLQ